MYGTVMGSFEELLAFSLLDDDDYFSHLEMHMRHEHPPSIRMGEIIWHIDLRILLLRLTIT